MADLWTVLTGVEALATAASGGAFLTYSGFTTTALAALPEREGLSAMQQVNLAAPRSPPFMALVFGPALLGVVLGIHALLDLSAPGAGLVLAGAVVYVLGVVVMTIAFHIPRNTVLAGRDPAADAATFGPWLDTWVAGNHVRTLSGLISSCFLLGGLVLGGSAVGS